MKFAPNINFCRDVAEQDEPETYAYMNGTEVYEITVERVQ